MNELMEKFAAARFSRRKRRRGKYGYGFNAGKSKAQEMLEPRYKQDDDDEAEEKKAFFEIFRSVDPKKKAIRDKIEDRIRAEQLKRDQAKEQIAYGKQRLDEAGKPSGLLGWSSDIARALIPGLSISASSGDHIVKEAEGEEEPTETPADKKWGGRLFDIAHLGAAGTGAGLGYARATGRLQDLGSVMSMARKGGQPLRDELAKALGGKMKNWAVKGDNAKTLALAASKPGLISRTVRKLTPTYWWRKLLGKPTTPAEAQRLISKAMRHKGVGARAIRNSMDDIIGTLGGRLKNVVGTGKGKVKLPGKWGALAGAALFTAPFALSRLWKTRNLRASGGSAGQEAARKAEELLSGAEKLRKEREALMQQLG